MKRFEFDFDLKLRVNNYTLFTQAKQFLLLDTFGFDVSDVTINLFSDDFLTHAASFCGLLRGNDFSVDCVNALTFYKNVLETDNDSSYCKNCFSTADLSTGNTVLWWRNVSWLSNMVLYTSEPITDIRFFHTVSVALYFFKESVKELQAFFSSETNAFYNEVISVQNSRLKTARDFFTSDEKFLVKELSTLINNCNYLKSMGMINVLNNVSFSNTVSVTVAPLPNFTFDGSYISKRKDTKFGVVNKLLNILECLFTDTSEHLLCGSEMFLKLWQEVNFKAFGFEFLVLPVSVSKINILEFTEILTVLCKNELFLTSDFSRSSDEFSFNPIKFKNDVETAVLLTLNK